MGVLFRNAILVDYASPAVRSGDLYVDKGRISAVGKELPGSTGDDVVDCHGAVIMPGLVNGHMHLYSALAPGMPAPKQSPSNFHEILRYVWWRLDRAHNSASIKMSGLVGATGSLRNGVTTIIDHHASPSCIEGSLDYLSQGIAMTGCRAVLCYEITNRNYPDEALRGLAENERFIEKCRGNKQDRFAGMMGAHASFTLSDRSLAACAETASRLGVGIHVHAAEDPVDEQISRDKYGFGIIERLQNAGIFDVPETIIAHGTHFSDKDIHYINTCKNISIAHNPRSNMNNGVGYAPVSEFVPPVMLGTDGIDGNLFAELQAAVFRSHESDHHVQFDHVLKMLGNSAEFVSRSLGVKVGVLEPGAAADIVLTSYIPATPINAENLAAHFIFALSSAPVRDVMIAGEWVLKEGKPCGYDEAEMTARAREIAGSLWRRMQDIPL